MLFSSNKIVTAFKEEAVKTQQYKYKLNADGHTLFQAMPDGLKYILVDPGTDYELKILGAKISNCCKMLVNSLSWMPVFRDGAGEGHINDHLTTIRDFEHYYLVMSQSGHPAIAPDEQNRTMMAVFTYVNRLGALQRMDGGERTRCGLYRQDRTGKHALQSRHQN